MLNRIIHLLGQSSLILDMACMDTPYNGNNYEPPTYITDSGEDSERGADNGTRGSAEMMRIYPLHAFETAAPASNGGYDDGNGPSICKCAGRYRAGSG